MNITDIDKTASDCEIKFVSILPHGTVWVKKKFRRLEGYGIKNMWPIFETKMLIYQSKANLDVKILFREITDHLDPEIRKMLERCLYWNQHSTFHSGP